MEDKKRQVFRQNLIHYRRMAGLTQTALSEACGMSRAVVSSWEQGRTMPIKPHTYGKLARALGCAVSDLVGR